MTQTIDDNGAVHDRRGRFAEKPSTAAAGAADLAVPEWTPPETTGTVAYQTWEDDYAVEYDSEDFDAAAVFDAYSLEEVENGDWSSSEEADQLYYDALKLGLITEKKRRDGDAFNVTTHEWDIEEYVEARREAGLEDPIIEIPLYSPKRLSEVSAEAMSDTLSGGKPLAEAMDWDDGDAAAVEWRDAALERCERSLADAQITESDLPDEDREAIERLRSAEGRSDSIRLAAWGLVDRILKRAVETDE